MTEFDELDFKLPEIARIFNLEFCIGLCKVTKLYLESQQLKDNGSKTSQKVLFYRL